jgi:hypothetical protein
MRYPSKLLLVVLLAIATTVVTLEIEQVPIAPNGEEFVANFDDNQADQIRFIIQKAGTMYSSNYDMVSLYIYGEIGFTFPGFWNVAVYRSKDVGTTFWMTGLYDEGHINKRYYKKTDVEGWNFSVVIVETNNSDPTMHGKDYSVRTPFPEVNLKAEDLLGGYLPEGLTYTKKKSPNVTTAQEAGIDLAMTTAYTWNKNVVDFTKVVQRLTMTNLNEHWEVYTRFENLNNNSFHYTSVDNQWVEYIGYGLGSYVLHVYLYKNYFTG